MAKDEVVLDGELSLNAAVDGETQLDALREGLAGFAMLVESGIAQIIFNDDYTITFIMTDGREFTTGSIRGATGPQGETGPQGPKGDPGDDYVLTAQDKADIAGLVDVPVDDVQINGTSIVSGGVANIPIATQSSFGIVLPHTGMGIGVVESGDKTGRLFVDKASVAGIKGALEEYRPIVPQRQHVSTFYGLAKAAGDTTQSVSSNAVGTYTENAKTAIRAMLGIDTASLVAEIRNALNL